MNEVFDFATLTALVVEDHPESALLLDAVLAESGMRLVSVPTAEEARGVVQTLRPDMILCDLALPGEDGLAFIRWLRATHGDGPDAIPAVAMTAFYERYGTREARDAGSTSSCKSRSSLSTSSTPSGSCWRAAAAPVRRARDRSGRRVSASTDQESTARGAASRRAR